MSRNKDDEEYLKKLNELNPDDVPLDIPRDDWDFPERLNKKQLDDLIGDKNKKKKIKVAKKNGKMRLMAKEGDFADREEFESEKEKKEASMNKKSKGGMIRKGYAGGGEVVTRPQQKCRGGGAATRGLGFTIS